MKVVDLQSVMVQREADRVSGTVREAIEQCCVDLLGCFTEGNLCELEAQISSYRELQMIKDVWNGKTKIS
jgi:hypothetical protein